MRRLGTFLDAQTRRPGDKRGFWVWLYGFVAALWKPSFVYALAVK